MLGQLGHVTKRFLAQSSGVVEYADCIPAKE